MESVGEQLDPEEHTVRLEKALLSDLGVGSFLSIALLIVWESRLNIYFKIFLVRSLVRFDLLILSKVLFDLVFVAAKDDNLDGRKTLILDQVTELLGQLIIIPTLV